MKVRRFAMPRACSLVGALVVGSCWSSGALAQDHDAHMMTSQHQPQTSEQRKQGNGLVKSVRDATERFSDVSVAENEGYGLLFGCVSGGDYGAMGLHFVNLPLVADGKIDAAAPEIVLYEPTSNGRLRITGADFVVLAADWDKTIRVRLSSTDSSFISSRPPIASGSRRSTRCTSGHGRTTRRPLSTAHGQAGTSVGGATRRMRPARPTFRPAWQYAVRRHQRRCRGSSVARKSINGIEWRDQPITCSRRSPCGTNV